MANPPLTSIFDGMGRISGMERIGGMERISGMGRISGIERISSMGRISGITRQLPENQRAVHTPISHSTEGFMREE